MAKITDSPVALVCFGAAAGAAFALAYHKCYTKEDHKSDTFDMETVLAGYRELEKWGLDYGSSMADNYFYGYLNIILPSANMNGGFKERVKEYKISQKLLKEIFPDKLFIVVHKSGYSPNTYETVHRDRFWARKKLECQVEGRNGIMKRLYQTPVYKINSPDKKKHITVVMEGAPCLRQMYESAQKNPAIRKFVDILVVTFVQKLQEKIKNHPECRHLCELVYFDDTPGLDTTGKSSYDWLANEFFRRANCDLSQYFL